MSRGLWNTMGQETNAPDYEHVQALRELWPFRFVRREICQGIISPITSVMWSGISKRVARKTHGRLQNFLYQFKLVWLPASYFVDTAFKRKRKKKTVHQLGSVAQRGTCNDLWEALYFPHIPLRMLILSSQKPPYYQLSWFPSNSPTDPPLNCAQYLFLSFILCLSL